MRHSAQRVAERPEIGSESDESCVNSVQFVAMAFICNGFGNLNGNEWDITGADDGCECEGDNEEGNDEDGNYKVLRLVLALVGMV